MNPLDALNQYLARVERRLRALTLARGVGLGAAAALAGTIGAVLLANAFAFAAPSVMLARVLLFLVLALTVAFALLGPLARLGRRTAARRVEHRHPEFEQRLLTITERDTPDPFLPLLAADSLRLAGHAEPDEFGPAPRVAAYSGLAAFCVAGLAWLILAGPGFLGYGAALLWGSVPKNQQPYYSIAVEPGNRTVRRRADQLIAARLAGFEAARVRLVTRLSGSARWNEVEMRRASGPRYEFLLAAVPDSVDYYVEAGGLRSAQYRLTVADLPSVRRIRVTYRYPVWTGLAPATEDPGGDLRAVAGSSAEIAIETDRPLANGALLLDNGNRIALRQQGKVGLATVPIQQDGSYYIASLERNEAIRISEDYFIEAQQDRPPSVRIARPGRDARVSPIEEVTVSVEGKDDFGLRELTLHYSVNAGPEKSVALLPRAGAKEAGNSTTLYLEDFKLAPGDVVSMYATARDARAAANTDIFFIEAQPFERRFRQSQQSGGGQGGEQQDGGNQISQRQKEIIAATWNQIRDTSGDKSAEAENAKFLSGVQSKLRDQARSLVNRMRSRQLAGASDSFRAFTESIDKAIAAMGPASEKLGGREWRGALAPEQQALQHLLRAEATFRDIQVAFGRQQGGGGRGGNQGRDLEGLFDLELDTEKNQYEAGQQSAAEQRQKEIDEALAKLEQLARRQQELAGRQQRPNPQQLSQQRWEQEMLRREAEQLRRQMEQIGRQGQQSGQAQSGQPSQSGQQSRTGQGQRAMSGGQQQLDRAIAQVDRALQNMRQADPRNAARQLQQAQQALSGMQRDRAGREMEDLVRRADQLAQQQREFGNKLREALSAGQGRNAEPLAQEKEQMIGGVQRLENDMQRTARGMESTDREAAARLRAALAELQQEEVAARMKWSAEAIRRGLGIYAALREAVTTQALDNVRQQLRNAQRAIDQQQQQQARQQGGSQAGGGRQGLERALNQAQRLRENLERFAGGSQTGAFSAMNTGERQPPPQRFAAGRGGDPGEAYREGVRGLQQLQTELREYPEISGELQTMIRQMQRLDPKRFPGNPALLEQLHSHMLQQVADVELRLRRLLDRQGELRTTTTEPPPPGYADAVAEYFRRLSRQKP